MAAEIAKSDMARWPLQKSLGQRIYVREAIVGNTDQYGNCTLRGIRVAEEPVIDHLWLRAGKVPTSNFPILRYGEKVRFTGVVVEYKRLNGSVDWSFRASDLEDVEVWRGGKWTPAAYPPPPDDEHYQGTFPPIRAVAPVAPAVVPAPAALTFESIRAGRQAIRAAGGVKGISAALAAAMAAEPHGGLASLLELAVALEEDQ